MSSLIVANHVRALIRHLDAHANYAAAGLNAVAVGRRPGPNAAPKSWFVAIEANGGDQYDFPISRPRVQFEFRAPSFDDAETLWAVTHRILIPADVRHTPIIEAARCRLWSPVMVAQPYTDTDESGNWPLAVTSYMFWKWDDPLPEEPEPEE